MPVAPTINQFCAVTLSTPHSDGTPSYVASQPSEAKPVYGIAAESAPSGSTLDIWGVGAIVANSDWAFSGGLPVYVADTNGALSTTAPTSAAYNVAGWSLDATHMVVAPMPPVNGAGSGTRFVFCNGGLPLSTNSSSGSNLINAKAGIGIGGSTATPVANGDIVIEATSNTLLTFKLQGSDGTVRTGTLALA